MAGEAPGISRRAPQRILLFMLCMLALLLATVVFLQWRSSAFIGSFQNDAAAHYVSGLMAHDWLVGKLGGNPVRYLIDYHAHLPLTAYGLWPPLYYGIESVWMVFAGTGKIAILSLSSVVTAALGLLTTRVVTRQAGWIAGLMAGLLLVANPLVQRASNELMLDVANALACLLAALAYAGYLANGSWRAAVRFGVLAAIATMVKSNALALACLPPLCVLIGRRWDLLLRPSFYLPALIVAVLAGPWYWVAAGLTVAFPHTWGPAYLKLATLYNAASIADGLTPIVTLLAVLGLGRVLWRRSPPGAEGAVEVACAALALSVFLFLLAIPAAQQDRYLIPCLAPLVVLAANEARRLLGRVDRPVPRGVLVAALVISALLPAIPVQLVIHDGFHDAAEIAQSALSTRNPVVLLVTDGETEPGLIAEFAMAEPRRPVAWVIRGSRLFGGGGYFNSDYQPRFTEPRALLGEIDRYGVSMVAFRRTGSPREWAHIAQFAALLDLSPERFERLAEIPGSAVIRIYRVVGNQERNPDAAALTQLNGPRTLMKLAQ